MKSILIYLTLFFSITNLYSEDLSIEQRVEDSPVVVLASCSGFRMLKPSYKDKQYKFRVKEVLKGDFASEKFEIILKGKDVKNYTHKSGQPYIVFLNNSGQLSFRHKSISSESSEYLSYLKKQKEDEERKHLLLNPDPTTIPFPKDKNGEMDIGKMVEETPLVVHVFVGGVASILGGKKVRAYEFAIVKRHKGKHPEIKLPITLTQSHYEKKLNYYESGKGYVLFLEEQNGKYYFKYDNAIVLPSDYSKYLKENEGKAKEQDRFSFIKSIYDNSIDLLPKEDGTGKPLYQPFDINGRSTEGRIYFHPEYKDNFQKQEPRFYSGFRVTLKNSNLDLLLSLFKSSAPYYHTFDWVVFDKKFNVVRDKKKFASTLPRELKEKYTETANMEVSRFPTSKTELGEQYFVCFETLDDVVQQIEVAFGFLATNEKDMSKVIDYPSPSNQLIADKKPYSSKRPHEINYIVERGLFLEKYAKEFPLFELLVDNKGKARFQKFMKNEKLISYKGQNYSGFRIKVPSINSYLKWAFYEPNPKGVLDGMYHLMGIKAGLGQRYSNRVYDTPQSISDEYPNCNEIHVQTWKSFFQKNEEYLVWFSSDSIYQSELMVALNFSENRDEDFRNLLNVDIPKEKEIPVFNNREDVNKFLEGLKDKASKEAFEKGDGQPGFYINGKKVD